MLFVTYFRIYIFNFAIVWNYTNKHNLHTNKLKNECKYSLYYKRRDGYENLNKII